MHTEKHEEGKNTGNDKNHEAKQTDYFCTNVHCKPPVKHKTNLNQMDMMIAQLPVVIIISCLLNKTKYFARKCERYDEMTLPKGEKSHFAVC